MAAAEMAQQGPDGLGHLRKLGKDFLQRHSRHVRMILDRIVQSRDIGLMMPVVMNLHDLGIDMRLQRVGRVRQGTELERAGGRLSDSNTWRDGGGDTGGEETATIDWHVPSFPSQ